MSITYLAEFAGMLSAHAVQIVESPERVSLQHLATLRTLSEKRRDAWLFRLRAMTEHSHLWSVLKPDESHRTETLIQEILVSELLTRVHAGVLLARSIGSGSVLLSREASRLVRDHQEVRRAALSQMLNMADQHDETVRGLDRIRRLAERWNDMLLAPLLNRCPIEQWMFDARRSRDFATGCGPLQLQGRSRLVLSGLQVAFPPDLEGVPTHRGLHNAMVRAIIGTLPQDAFDSDGTWLPIRTARLNRPPVKTDGPPTLKRPQAPKSQSGKTSPKLSFRELRNNPKDC